MFTDLKHILIELGLYSFKKAYNDIIKTNKLEETLTTISLNIKIKNIDTLVKSIVANFDHLIKSNLPDSLDEDVNNILVYSSAKVKALVAIFRKVNRQENLNPGADYKFHSIIFAERKKTVYYLDSLFREISSGVEDLNFIKSTFIHGTSQLNAEDAMNHKKQVNIFQVAIQLT